MKIAFVHDWLFGMRGGERCLEELCRIFPEADVYTLFYRPKAISPVVNRHRIFQSFLSHLPGVERYYRHLLPILPLGLFHLSRQLRREHYDVVVSVSHCMVKNIRPRDGTRHICYCLTPARYYWDQFDVYFSGNALRPLIHPVIRILRAWDRKAAQPNTEYVAISRFVAERMRTVLGVEASVIYPPVRTDWIPTAPPGEAGCGFICVNALVPYKRVRLVVEAFNQLGEPLHVIGKGPELSELRRIARENIRFTEYLDEAGLARAYREAKALVFAAEEDFGIIPLEVQAAGRPVICFGSGGALETVVSEGNERTGVFFSEPSVPAIVETIKRFLQEEERFSREACLKNAERFSVAQFRTQVGELVCPGRRFLHGGGLSREVVAEALGAERRETNGAVPPGANQSPGANGRAAQEKGNAEETFPVV